MSDSTDILDIPELAKRWHCTVSKLRNTRPEHLPPRLRLPGSRRVLFRLVDIEAWEAARVDPLPEPPRQARSSLLDELPPQPTPPKRTRKRRVPPPVRH